jgi:cytochrome P450
MPSEDIHHNDLIIPSGSVILVNMMAMYRQPWINSPDEYLPERWQEDNPQINELKEMFIPFSSGKRSCIGQNLALMEIRVIVANLVRYFHLELVDPELELDHFVTLKPVNLRLRFKPRQLK